MLNFEYPSIEDRSWLRPILSDSGFMGSENAFGTLFLWSGSYHSRVCRKDGFVFLSSGEHFHTYNFPFTEDPDRAGDLGDALRILIADAREKGHRFQMWGMTPRETKLMEEALPGTFEFTLDRDGSDYLYSPRDLIELSGRKFHGKRNHLARFNRQYQWTYEDVTPENLEPCREVAREWCRQNGCTENGLDKEACALRRAFDYFAELHLLGGLIRIDGKPVAFTIGEEINPKTFLLHFEKALPDYEGLYAAINHEFAAKNLSGYEYVNREEDMGLEGLRRAKLSYNPSLLLEKYRAVLKKSGNE